MTSRILILSKNSQIHKYVYGALTVRGQCPRRSSMPFTMKLAIACERASVMARTTLLTRVISSCFCCLRGAGVVYTFGKDAKRARSPSADHLYSASVCQGPRCRPAHSSHKRRRLRPALAHARPATLTQCDATRFGIARNEPQEQLKAGQARGGFYKREDVPKGSFTRRTSFLRARVLRAGPHDNRHELLNWDIKPSTLDRCELEASKDRCGQCDYNDRERFNVLSTAGATGMIQVKEHLSILSCSGDGDLRRSSYFLTRLGVSRLMKTPARVDDPRNVFSLNTSLCAAGVRARISHRALFRAF
ncbi:hypothetical protein EVAR_29036_1 [Eumeta japonica]|uniref:Uncharacterized protein n=1 Tax=Eumeta variegata TaxID=151549 RepID=A0A4C1W1U6_EUMVA|nr:hypothetical protein EVAR_29036_1 [Eumeta japonica]